MLSPGVRFDRYEIESLLGEGGMGRVYLARDTRLGRSVALKVLHHAFAEGDGALRLLREARAAAALEHPNAVAIFDVGEVDGVAYLAMEHLEGRLLRDCIGDPDIPVAQRLRWLADIARALSAAHARGLVHRDIKPGNVMIRADGAVKVLDFGIARQAQSADSLGATAREVAPRSDTFTQPGMVVGTPDYMAPEQMLAKPVDGRSDQFAWGVTAYELLSGSRPWTDSTDFVRLIAEVVSPDPVPTLRGRAEVPLAVVEVVDRALSKEPSARFTSMNEIVKLLDSMTAPRRSVPPPRRRWLFLAAVVGALATMAGFATVALVSRREPRKPLAPAVDHVAAAPTSMVDLPVPPGARAEAVLAFRRARQDLHDGSLWRGGFELRSAWRLDPSLVAPLVPLLTWDISDGIMESRAAFSAAHQLRASLSERDRSLLEAMAPIFATGLSDLPAGVAKLEEASLQYPADAEVQAVAAYWLSKLGRSNDANAAIDRALALDPTFAAAHFTRAWITHDGALQQRSLEACIDTSPTAASCVRSLARIRQQAGDCASMESLASKLSAIEPDFEWSYVYGLNAIVSRGGSREETVPVLHAIEASVRAQARADGKPENGDTVWPAMVAFHYGAFDEGLKLLGALPVEDDTRARFSMLAAQESGDLLRAAAEARAYIARRRMRSGGSVTLDTLALHLAAEAGHEPAAQTLALAAEWADQDAHFDGPQEAPLDTILLKAGVLSGPESLRQAFAGQSLAGIDLSPGSPNALNGDALLGHLLAQGGRPDDALPILREASRACGLAHSEAIFTFARVTAEKDLADVLAAKGDTVGACDLLGKIVVQWGKATPRSVTAEAAKVSRKALACPE